MASRLDTVGGEAKQVLEEHNLLLSYPSCVREKENKLKQNRISTPVRARPTTHRHSVLAQEVSILGSCTGIWARRRLPRPRHRYFA